MTSLHGHKQDKNTQVYSQLTVAQLVFTASTCFETAAIFRELQVLKTMTASYKLLSNINGEIFTPITRGADKSLARPGRKQARNHVRDARDFNNIETRAVIKFPPPARQGAEGNSRHSDRKISLFPSWSG